MSDTPFSPRGSGEEVESGLTLMPKFDENGLIPAIAADAETNEVLMLAYMNEEALRRTLELGEAVYYSRSRQELWHKGATSGAVQKVKEIRVDCDQDALILLVDQQGGAACHTGMRSCFFRSVKSFGNGNASGELEHTGGERMFDPAEVYGKKS